MGYIEPILKNRYLYGNEVSERNFEGKNTRKDKIRNTVIRDELKIEGIKKTLKEMD